MSDQPPREKSKQEVAARCEKSSELAHTWLKWLSKFALENPKMGGALLVAAARAYCEAVSDWSEAHPNEAKALARTLPVWPCVYGRHLAIKEDTEEALNSLGLAEDHLLAGVLTPSKKRPIDLRGPANTKAVMIFEGIHRSKRAFHVDQEDYAGRGWGMPQWRKKAQGLKPLSIETAEKWFDVGWAGCIESNLLPEMLGNDGKPLGYYRRDHNFTFSAFDQEEPSNRTADSNIRDGTKTRVRTAFLAMVRRLKL